MSRKSKNNRHKTQGRFTDYPKQNTQDTKVVFNYEEPVLAPAQANSCSQLQYFLRSITIASEALHATTCPKSMEFLLDPDGSILVFYSHHL
nr:12532_t:CDS:2 [Entrophospora candida]